MKCPKCGVDNNKVVDSRSRQRTQYRRRMCQNCGEKFSTTEYYVHVFNVEEKGCPAWIEKIKGKEFSWGK